MSQPSIETVRAHLIAAPSEHFNLSARDTGDKTLFPEKEDAEQSLKDDADAINDLQDLLRANDDQALLVVLQGMDTAGKSGVIRRVFGKCSPLGVNVSAFKAPTKLELAHDFLWRVHQVVPRSGHIGIFDRSHYEDVLVVKVRNFAPADIVEQRYEQINAFEKHLSENKVKILKFMLNVGYEEQGERLRDRLHKEDKRWKFNPGDLEDRKLFPQFMDAYEVAVDRCSTEHAPWYIIPADSRTRRSAMIARIVRGALEDMNMSWPDPDLKSESDYDFGPDAVHQLIAN